jgi:hypothetical protein
MPSGGKRKGVGAKRKLSDVDHLDIVHDYKAQLDLCRRTKQPGPHRDRIIQWLAGRYEQTPRMIVRVLDREYPGVRALNRKYTGIKTRARR